MAPRFKKGELVGTRRSSASRLGSTDPVVLPLLLLCIMEAATAATEAGGIEAGNGNCCWELM